MTNWVLTAGLQNLRAQVNARWPHRDHTSDGTIGDAAHQAETSGHNPDDTAGSKAEWNGDPDSTPEVRAWDMDSDLGDPSCDAQDVVDHLRSLPGLASVIRYMIYNRLEYHESTGFKPVPYTGASAHTEHIHFSGAYTQAADNNTTFDYRLDEVGTMALADDKIAITADTAAEIGKKAGDSVSAAVLLQLAVIHGARADDNAAAAKTQAASMVPIVASLDNRLKTIEDWYERIGDPGTSDADVAAALDALLGSRKAAVLALM